MIETLASLLLVGFGWYSRAAYEKHLTLRRIRSTLAANRDQLKRAE